MRLVLTPVLSLVILGAFFAYLWLASVHTLASPGFYTGGLSEERVYDRLYDEVLVDPAIRETREELLGGIDVPADDVALVAKRVLSPDYLQGETEGTLESLAAYLKKDTEVLELYVDLAGPLAKAGDELTAYAEDRVDAIEVVPVEPEDLEAFTEEALLTVKDGRLPEQVPSFEGISVAERLDAYDGALERLRLDPEVPREVLEALDDPDTDRTIREALAKEGVEIDEDLRGALRAASSGLVTPLVDEALDDVRRELSTPDGSPCSRLPEDADLSACTMYDVLDLVAPEDRDRDDLLSDLEEARDGISRFDKLGTWLPLLVLALAALALFAIDLPRVASALRRPALALAFTGLVFLVVGLVARALAPKSVERAVQELLDDPDVPESVARIASDLAVYGASDLTSALIGPSIALLVIGLVVFVGSFFISIAGIMNRFRS